MIPTANEPLSSEVSDKLKHLCNQGYLFFDKGDTKAALRLFYQAWTILPKPQNQWLEAAWVLTALGDVYFAKGDYEYGREALLSALHCSKAMGDPVIHLRLGQCLLELGQHSAAQLQFKQVLKNGGEALFKKENNKYFELLESATLK